MNRQENRERLGAALLATFPRTRIQISADLYRACRRLEKRAHKAAEAYSNGDIGERAYSQQSDRLLEKTRSLLGATDEPIFVNNDPRGYALKVKPEWAASHGMALHRDWGGYGILAPDPT